MLTNILQNDFNYLYGKKEKKQTMSSSSTDVEMILVSIEKITSIGTSDMVSGSIQKYFCKT